MEITDEEKKTFLRLAGWEEFAGCWYCEPVVEQKLSPQLYLLHDAYLLHMKGKSAD